MKRILLAVLSAGLMSFPAPASSAEVANLDSCTAPGGLALVSIDTLTFTLAWTAPQGYNDDIGYIGPVDEYELRYSITPIVSNFYSFEAMTPAQAELPPPASFLTPQQGVVSGLQPGTEYWFVFRCRYGTYHSYTWPFAVTTSTDTHHPGALADLAIAAVFENAVEVTCTAPGDDGMTGTAARYDLRRSTAGPVTGATWDAAISVPVAAPLAGGSPQRIRIGGLAGGMTYWFAARVFDEVGNAGVASGSLPVTTLVPPPSDPDDQPGICGATARSFSGSSLALLCVGIACFAVARNRH